MFSLLFETLRQMQALCLWLIDRGSATKWQTNTSSSNKCYSHEAWLENMFSVMKLHLKFMKDEMYVVNSIENKIKKTNLKHQNSTVLF